MALRKLTFFGFIRCCRFEVGRPLRNFSCARRIATTSALLTCTRPGVAILGSASPLALVRSLAELPLMCMVPKV